MGLGAFIEEFAFAEGGAEHGADDVASARDLLGGRYDDVFGYGHVSEDAPDLDGGSAPVGSVAHNDEKVDVAVLVGRAPGLGAEEEDADRVEAFDDAFDHCGDGGLGSHRAAP